MSETDEQIAKILEHYGLNMASTATFVEGGTLNANFRVQTDHGTVFVRRHRQDQPVERIQAEHEVLAWVSARGIPVAEPLKDNAGRTLQVLPGGNWAVFPWVDGIAPDRGHIAPPQASAIGEMHGRIHRVLAAHPTSSAPFTAPIYNLERAAAGMERLLQIAEQAGEITIAGSIRVQLGLLAEQGREGWRLDSVPNSMSHGDYHDQQLLFSGDDVVAVVDWEMCGMRPRVFEVYRSLAFSRLLDLTGIAAYVSGYREHMALTEEECFAGVELWWQTRIHNNWAYHAYLVERNERVKPFFPESHQQLLDLADPAHRERLATAMWQAAREE